MFRPIHKIHFLGICGTAMGSVAAAIRDLGFSVTGSDENVYPPMSTFLSEKGIPLSRGFRAENLPDDVDLVVIGNAIMRGNPEVEAVLDRKLLYRSLPETLKEFILQKRRNIVVTGTHGKTTTTSLLAWIFEKANKNPSYLIGGLARNLGRGAAFRDSEYVLIEGDEYDTAFFDKRSKFLHYLPECVVINNIEFDHADIFSSLDEIKLSFQRLVNIVPGQGRIFLNADDEHCLEVVRNAFAPVVSVGFAETATHCLSDVSYDAHGASFQLRSLRFRTLLNGEFNVRNSAMAAAVAMSYGLSRETVNEALATFTGVARRQELRGEINSIKVIDDFGHHPTAIRETLSALRQKFPGNRLLAIFEPRSNTSRRATFQSSLPAALQLADGVILSRVARVEQLPPGDRLDPSKVVDELRENGVPAFYEPEMEGIVERTKLLARPGDVIIIFSNGGFEGIHEKLLTVLATA
jgi:UDP-N-acetylmuramate: L-alanyl-gamma-D-glutamyl-meso-diaminopimelate ligase